MNVGRKMCALKLESRLIGSTVLTAAFGAHCPHGDEPELAEASFVSTYESTRRVWHYAHLVPSQLANEVVIMCNVPACIINFFPFFDWIPGPMPWRTRTKAFHKREDTFYSKLIAESVSGKWVGMNTYVVK